MPSPDYYVGPNAAQLRVLIRFWREEHDFELNLARAWRLTGTPHFAAQHLKRAGYARLKVREYLACWHHIRPGQSIDIA